MAMGKSLQMLVSEKIIHEALSSLSSLAVFGIPHRTHAYTARVLRH